MTMEKETDRQTRKKWRWAPHYEVTEKLGPDGKLLFTQKTWKYLDNRWPTKRDLWNVLCGAAAALMLLHLAGMPM